MPELESRTREFSDEDLSRAAPQVLACLMSVEGDLRTGIWRPEELGEILRHQLDAPLLFDLGSLEAVGDAGAGPLDRDIEAGQVRNFGALFCHARPPLALLRLTKDFAKISDRRSANPLPAEVATVLYYASIVAAVLRHGERISRINDETLRDGTNWVLQQPWVIRPLRDLFVEFQAGRDPEVASG